jgi:hypothetical protein
VIDMDAAPPVGALGLGWNEAGPEAARQMRPSVGAPNKEEPENG